MAAAVVTGANRGLGLEFVRQLAAGSTYTAVYAGCRDPNSATDLQKLSERIKKIRILKLDVNDDAHIAAAAEVVARETAGVALLLNNAGVGDMEGPNHLREQSRDVLCNHFNVNAVSPIIVTQKFENLLKKAAATGGATVVNVSSFLGSFSLNEHLGGLYMYPYRTSKAAVNMATHCLAEDLRSDGITVVAMHPGWAQTAIGGPNATMTTEESVRNCLQVIGGLALKHTGKFLDHRGRVMQW